MDLDVIRELASSSSPALIMALIAILALWKSFGNQSKYFVSELKSQQEQFAKTTKEQRKLFLEELDRLRQDYNEKLANVVENFKEDRTFDRDACEKQFKQVSTEMDNLRTSFDKLCDTLEELISMQKQQQNIRRRSQ